jgi:HK97 family phage major capsid protein/HK97 family phage prohead protease
VDRAYALLEIKAVDAERRRFSGIASTPELDRQGDSIDPAGATFRAEIPLLFHHDQKQPVGTARLSLLPDGRIGFDAEIATVDEPGVLKNRVDEAWQSVKAGLMRGVSIGFQAAKDGIERLASGARKLTKTEICELSLVTIPANRNATILTVKSLAAPARPRSAMKTTTGEHVTNLEHKRAAHVGRMTEIMETAAADAATLTDEAATEHDELGLQVKQIDADLVRWRELDRMQVAAAVPVPETPKGGGLFIANPRPVISVKANVEPGTGFIRYCQALAASRGNAMQAVEYAKRWHDSTPEVELVLKAAVAAGTTTDATWAGPLAPIKPLTDEFIAYLRPATILGRIPTFLKVPFNVSIAAQTGGGTYGWVGQGAPKPVGKLAFATVTLGITKCAGIIVITEELARNSSPDAESVIRRDMVAGIAQFLDQQFIDPAAAAVAGVSPGSVTNGVTPITTAGTSPANARTDIQAMANAMTALNISTAGAYLILSESNALALTNALNPLGQQLFPGMSQQGGTIMGYQAVASQAAGTTVALIKPDQILYADDGGVTIDVSREASLQMDSAPMAVPDATVVLTSLWQMNYVGLRAERFINWKKARTGVVQYTVATYAA